MNRFANVWALLLGALLAPAAPVRGADEPARWSRPWDIETETEFSRDRVDAPWNQFLLDGQQGFISGRDFYQAAGEVSPFLWPSHPFLRYGTDRGWQSDSLTLDARLRTGNEIGDAILQELPPGAEPNDNRTPLTSGDVSWAPFESLRLHAGLDQNDHSSYHTFPFRLQLAGNAKVGDLAWFGENLPPKSQATAGLLFERRGSTMAAQFNQGWWWTNSPVSGFAYPWEGINADLTYKPGEDFELSLTEQHWNSPLDQRFYRAEWRRSELAMGFMGSSPGGWVWRLDLGFQRREMRSDSLFKSFLEQSYPARFRYRQVWSAPDSIPVQMLTTGSMGFRERMILMQHTTEFREKWGTHQPRQILKGFWRHPMDGYHAPTEYLASDTGAAVEYHPGKQARGVSVESEYREKRKTFEAGLSGAYAIEWNAPLFRLDGLDSLYGIRIRRGIYTGSEHLLQNATGRLFAGGNVGAKGFWKSQAGWREFRGEDADSMEFRPSRYWVSGGAGYAFPSDLKVEANAHWMGDKEVRGWGPVFTVPAHLENNLTLEQSLLDDRLKLSLTALHAFGEDIREQPNANPVRFRILVGIQGTLE